MLKFNFKAITRTFAGICAVGAILLALTGSSAWIIFLLVGLVAFAIPYLRYLK